MAQEKITQNAGRTQLGEFAPKFGELNDDVLFGEVWNRPGLSPHDRSMITVATLVGKGIIDSSLSHHLQFAKQNGVTRTEIAEMLTHIAFYAGWPNAWGAFRLAKDVWADSTAANDAKAAFQREMIFPIGEPNTAYAKYFIGNSYLAPVSSEQIPFNNVTFEPRCRNNWHIHHATKGGGQMLVCAPGIRNSRRGHFKRMARTRDRRGIRQTREMTRYRRLATCSVNTAGSLLRQAACFASDGNWQY